MSGDQGSSVGGQQGAGAGDHRVEALRLADAFRARVVDATTESFVFEMTGTADKLDAFLALMRPLGLAEVSRTGAVAIARGDLIAAGKRADVALDFEGLSVVEGRDMGSIARRSSNGWVLTTSGKTGHSSLIFSDAYGDGAINEMARILAAFRKDLPEPNLTFNTGVVAGGATAQAREI